MKVIQKLIVSTLTIFAVSTLTASRGEASTHVFNNYAIRSISVQESDMSYKDKIIVLKSQFIPNPIRGDLFNIPKVGAPIWIITAKDLQVTEEVCLIIDATLCANSPNSHQAQCHSSCITSGPEFVAFDEKASILYIDAGTDVSGTGGTPRFLFAADLKRKQIKYLNTFVAPYTAYLSPNGKYLALDSGWNEISVCNTKTGNFSEAHYDDALQSVKKNRLGRKIVKWLNNEELEYGNIGTDNNTQSLAANAGTLKVFNAETKKTTTLEK